MNMSNSDNKDFIERFTVRMPTGMRDEIAKTAEENGRSMNSEIVQVLQDYLNDRNKKNSKKVFHIADDFVEKLEHIAKQIDELKKNTK